MFWKLYEYTLQSGNGGGRERKLAVFGIGTLCFESLHFMFFFFFLSFFTFLMLWNSKYKPVGCLINGFLQYLRR